MSEPWRARTPVEIVQDMMAAELEHLVIGRTKAMLLTTAGTARALAADASRHAAVTARRAARTIEVGVVG